MSTPKKRESEVSQSIPIPSKVNVSPEAANAAISIADQIAELKPVKKREKGVI